MLRSSRHVNMFWLSHSLGTWKNRDENQINWKTVNHRNSECNHSGLKAMDPNAIWCIHPWSPCFLHTQLPCLALLAVEQSCCTFSSTQVLASFPLVRICTYVLSAVLLSICAMQMMQTGYCCLTVGEFFLWVSMSLRHCGSLFVGQAGTGSSKGSCSFTETEECRLYFQ